MLFPSYCAALHPFLNVHGLSCQPLSRCPVLYIPYVLRNGGSLFSHEALNHIEKRILTLLCPFIIRSFLYPLQCDPIYRSISAIMVLSNRWKRHSITSILFFSVRRAPPSHVLAMGCFCNIRLKPVVLENRSRRSTRNRPFGNPRLSHIA